MGVLEFRSNNQAHQPAVEALELVKRYAKAGNTSYYPLGESVSGHRSTAGPYGEVRLDLGTRLVIGDTTG